jgi:hypothetical protein
MPVEVGTPTHQHVLSRHAHTHTRTHARRGALRELHGAVRPLLRAVLSERHPVARLKVGQGEGGYSCRGCACLCSYVRLHVVLAQSLLSFGQHVYVCSTRACWWADPPCTAVLLLRCTRHRRRPPRTAWPPCWRGRLAAVQSQQLKVQGAAVRGRRLRSCGSWWLRRLMRCTGGGCTVHRYKQPTVRQAACISL